MRLSYKKLLYYWSHIEKVQQGDVTVSFKDDTCNITRTEEEVIISFDGSSTLKEWWGNLKALRTVIGFHKNFKRTAEGFIPKVNQYIRQSDNIVITGTSRGGAIAILVAYMLSIMKYNVMCVTFVQPKVAIKKGYRNLINSNIEVHRVIIGMDIVDNLPPFFKHYETFKYKLKGVRGKLNHTAIRKALEHEIRKRQK
jgi:hypothetical protein